MKPFENVRKQMEATKKKKKKEKKRKEEEKTGWMIFFVEC